MIIFMMTRQPPSWFRFREEAWGTLVSRGFRKVSAPEKPLQYLKPYDYRAVSFTYFVNMARTSLHTRSFRRIHLSVFRYRLTKNGFADPKSFRDFRETGPRDPFLESPGNFSGP